MCMCVCVKACQSGYMGGSASVVLPQVLSCRENSSATMPIPGLFRQLASKDELFLVTRTGTITPTPECSRADAR